MTEQIPWDKVTRELIRRWGGQAPRYTSYPTAAEWAGEFTHEDFVSALSRADIDTEDPISLYIHIPFCRKRCLFCGCASDVCTDSAVYDAYLDTIAVEIENTTTHLPKRRKVGGLHLGGGTPTVLSPDQFRRLFSILSENFDFSETEELALEAAPAVTQLEQIDTLAVLGFNRISFGVQDFSQAVQRAVDRIQSTEQTRSLIAEARAHGMAVNIDLMYGLPHQHLDTWQETLDEVLAIAPDRLAVFGYAHVPWMRPHQKQLEEQTLPDAELRLALFRAAHERMISAGYVHIGMDHFARPTDPLAEALESGTLWRNFQGYAVKQASILLGFGATAISDFGTAFAQNIPKTDAYEASVKEKGCAIFRGMKTSEEDRLRRHIITELMCNLALDIPKLSERFGIDFRTRFAYEREGLERLAADGIIEYDNNSIQVTGLGRLFVRHVGLVFDTYSSEKVKKAKFSRTV